MASASKYGDDGRAERLAAWVREMSLEDQLFITGTTLVFEQMRRRRTDLPVAIDEAALRESSPGVTFCRAMELSEAYAAQPPYQAPDGIDEHWRISNMARELADRIAAYHPHVRDGRS